MRILITGGNGMVGRNLREHSALKQWEVFAPSSAELDLLDARNLETRLRDLRPDIIVHAAGRVGGIGANSANNAKFLYENMVMGLNLVKAAHEANIPRILNLASSCMYPKDSPDALTEDMVLTGPIEPTNEGYALAKISVYRYCALISRDIPGRHYKTVVPCNLYGRWDKFEAERAHLIPAIIAKVHHAVSEGAATVEIWGDGSARREFLYAADFADFLVEAIDRFEALPDVINVGRGEDHSVLDYYRAVAEVLGFRGEFSFDLSKPVGMKRKLMDITKARAWGWAPSRDLEQGIRETVRFFRERTEGSRHHNHAYEGGLRETI
jgi:GDP-L-fucose synthase